MGEETIILDVRNICSFTDLFILTSVNSRTQLKAVGDFIEIKLKGEGEYPINVDGTHNSNWGVLDYGDIVVHIFLPEARSYYDLERLWGDAKIIKYNRKKSKTSD